MSLDLAEVRARPHALDDHFLVERLQQVVAERGINVIVETGIAEGNSSVKFCRMVPRYVGIDIDPERIAQARWNIESDGVSSLWELHQGDSPEVMRRVMPTIPAHSTLFFLDSHNFPGDPAWPKPTWPMPEEIRAIPRGQGVLCFHDFQVPGKDFGVDGYWIDDGSGVPANRQLRPFDYALVKPYLDEWSPTHRVEYMEQASGSYRGVGFVYPS